MSGDNSSWSILEVFRQKFVLGLPVNVLHYDEWFAVFLADIAQR